MNWKSPQYRLPKITQAKHNVNGFSFSYGAVDGIYTEETRFAVEQFQSGRDLNVTGRVDKETFDLLYQEAYLIENGNDDEIYVRFGDIGENAGQLNSILRELGEFYKDIYPLPYGNIFSRNTASALSAALNHLSLPISGQISNAIIKRLQKELRARKTIRQLKNSV